MSSLNSLKGLIVCIIFGCILTFLPCLRDQRDVIESIIQILYLESCIFVTFLFICQRIHRCIIFVFQIFMRFSQLVSNAILYLVFILAIHIDFLQFLKKLLLILMGLLIIRVLLLIETDQVRVLLATDILTYILCLLLGELQFIKRLLVRDLVLTLRVHSLLTS